MQKSNKKIFTVFDASAYRVGIVQAMFNNDITDQILQTAQNKLAEYGVSAGNIKVCEVSGSVEIPVVLQALAQSKKYDCLIAIGTVIKGHTDHYTFVAQMVSSGVLRVMLDNTIPIGFAVLTTDNKQLAEERIGIGADAAEAVLQTVFTIQSL